MKIFRRVRFKITQKLEKIQNRSIPSIALPLGEEDARRDTYASNKSKQRMHSPLQSSVTNWLKETETQ